MTRSSSEPPEDLNINQKTGLRRGFPIKISGRALGSQESLSGRTSERGLFGQRIGMRWTPQAPFSLAREALGEQKRNLRGSTPIRNAEGKNEVTQQRSSFMSKEGLSERRRSLRGSTPIRSTDEKGESPAQSSLLMSPLGKSGEFNRRKSIGGVMSRGPASYTEPVQDYQSENTHLDNGNKIQQSRNKSEKSDSSQSVLNNFGQKGDKNTSGSKQLSGHSKDEQTNSLQNDMDHEIKNISEKITALEMDAIFSDVKLENQFDTELQTMKDNLEELNLEKESIETSNSLDDVITKMKNSLKAIKDGVNHNTLVDLNREVTPLDLPPLREMTPLDLPALSPLPPMMLRRKKVTKKLQLPTENFVSNPNKENFDKGMPGLIVNDSVKQETAWNIVNRHIDPLCDGQGQSNNEEVESSLTSCSITVQLGKHVDLGNKGTETKKETVIKNKNLEKKDIVNSATELVNNDKPDTNTVYESLDAYTNNDDIGTQSYSSRNTLLKEEEFLETVEIQNEVTQPAVDSMNRDDESKTPGIKGEEPEHQQGIGRQCNAPRTNILKEEEFLETVEKTPPAPYSMNIDDESKTPEVEEPEHQQEINSSESTYLFLSDDSSVCSTPTVMEMSGKGGGYESDSSVYPDTDCEESYGPFKIHTGDICEISDMESEEEEWQEINTRVKLKAMETPKLEMFFDHSNNSPKMKVRNIQDGPRPPTERMRRQSGRRKSMSGDKNIAKTRYCWRCHKAGHENWECKEDIQPDEWCARCLETTHWEDNCWVDATHVLCPICSVPGHLPAIHQATDFRQRKLVIDTFGWLSFKDWFQDLAFRSWWNCSGFTGVPLYKILMKNNSKDLDLGFDES